MEKVLDFALFFFIYAIAGWCVEVIHAALKRGKFENRGFLNGCWCPIYGVGVVLVLLCLTPININVFVLFIASLVLTSVLEFVVGFVLEKLFKTKWWDYSKEHFNIKGYVCVKYSILWGLACVIVVDLIHPMIEQLVNITSDLAKYIIVGVLGTAFVVDGVFTVIQLVTYKKNYAALEKIGDTLKKPSNAVGSKIAASALAMNEKMQKLNEKIKSSRLYKAFPEQLRKTKSALDTDALNANSIEEAATTDSGVEQ
ncbi:MAG: putative ABC transporter permease [Clostridiales bacterium]|nr:putative ABC transporter permease [Clostridiales bacterium]